jgi:hypothetical protein
MKPPHQWNQGVVPQGTYPWQGFDLVQVAKLTHDNLNSFTDAVRGQHFFTAEYEERKRMYFV